MNLRSSKGITLVALIITIIIMLIIAGITVYNGSGVIKEAKVQDVKTNMLLVEAKVKNYVEQARFEGKNTIDGITIEGATLNVTQSSSVSGYYTINDMSTINLGDLNNQDYLVSFNIEDVTVDVYFVPGITDSDGKTYHRLSEMEE